MDIVEISEFSSRRLMVAVSRGPWGNEPAFNAPRQALDFRTASHADFLVTDAARSHSTHPEVRTGGGRVRSGVDSNRDSTRRARMLDQGRILACQSRANRTKCRVPARARRHQAQHSRFRAPGRFETSRRAPRRCYRRVRVATRLHVFPHAADANARIPSSAMSDMIGLPSRAYIPSAACAIALRPLTNDKRSGKCCDRKGS